VLTALYPDADVPVIQLSLDRARSPQEHYEIAKALRPLRDEGIMILASGDIVHNLRAIDFRNPTPLDWAVRFNDQVKDLIVRGQHQPLIDYLNLGQDAALSINSAEHYLPLLYTLGVSEPGESLRFVTDEVFAAISMTGIVYGD
jgi:4,5-DOPA dioxygenase extradiol